jgi:uncharacterized protein YxeA
VEEQKKMKKILVVLLALTIIGGVFAESKATFTGDVKTGLRITQSGEADPSVDLYHDDSGERFYLEGNLTIDENYGLSFGLLSKPDAVTFNHARLYGEFLDDKLKITGGKSTGAVWNTGGQLDASFDDTDGFKIEVKPITGLDFGLQLRTVIGTGLMSLEQWGQEIRFGVTYTAANLFRAAAAFKLDSDFDDVPAVPANPNDPNSVAVAFSGDEGKDYRAAIGVSILAVPNLTAALDGYIWGLGDLDLYGKAGIGQKVAYALTPLTVGLGVYEILDLRDVGEQPEGTDSTLKLYAEPYVSYKLNDPVTLALNLPFWMGWNDSFAAADAFVGDTIFDIGVKPAITYTFNSTASIYAYYKLGVNQKKGVGGADDPKLVTTHTVQVNFAWSF